MRSVTESLDSQKRFSRAVPSYEMHTPVQEALGELLLERVPPG